MPRRNEGRGVFFHEHSLDKVNVFKHTVIELVLTRGFLIGDSRLKQMTRAVKLVIVAVGKALARLYDRVINIEISVLKLIFLNLVDYSIGKCLKLGGFFKPRNVCDRLYPLGDVRVPEEVGAVWHTLFPVAGERLYSPRIVKAVIYVHGGNVANKRLLLRPKTTCYFDVFKAYVFCFHVSLPPKSVKLGSSLL